MIYNCEFINPINLGNEENPDWNWENIICETASSTEMFELIEHPEIEGRGFFLEKTFNYGDLFLIFFLTLVLTFWIAFKITDYFWKK